MSESKEMTQTTPDQMTKEHLVNTMKYHRGMYEVLSTEWKSRIAKDELAKHFAEQKAMLLKFKERYSFYLDTTLEDGTMKPIDWDEVEKLITTNYSLNGEGYALCHDSMGVGGIGVGYYGGGGYSRMVRDDAEAQLVREMVANARSVKSKSK